MQRNKKGIRTTIQVREERNPGGDGLSGDNSENRGISD